MRQFLCTEKNIKHEMRLKLLVLTLLIFTMGWAQNGTVTGTVLDKDMNNEPLPFANVVVKGTALSTTTDEMGALHPR